MLALLLAASGCVTMRPYAEAVSDLPAGRLLEVDGRGERWATSLPVTLIVSGELVGAWSEVPPGSTVRATVRIEAPEAGEPVAAVLRVRAPPQVVGEPGIVDAAVAAATRSR